MSFLIETAVLTKVECQRKMESIPLERSYHFENTSANQSKI